MNKDVISKEQAEKELDNFFEEMDIDLDLENFNKEEKIRYESMRAIIVRASMAGRLTYTAAGEPVYTPAKGEFKPITLHEVTGAALMAGGKHENPITRDHAILAEMSGQAAGTFARMVNRDLKVLRTFLTFFTV